MFSQENFLHLLTPDVAALEAAAAPAPPEQPDKEEIKITLKVEDLAHNKVRFLYDVSTYQKRTIVL